MRIISRTVWVLSFVSLFADVASEMLYPVIPIYLKEIGFSVLLIGLLEGLAEFTVGLSKGYFGKLSDERGLRLPFVKLGYFLSSLSKPMMAVFTWPVWIFFARTLDRLGKGIRTSARDAILSQESTPETKGRVFSFHRSWDTVGAVLGPVIALVYLHYNHGQYKPLFYIAFVPGLLAVACIFLLKERKQESTAKKGGFFSFFSYWNIATPEYKKLVSGFLLFAIGNSSDVFLLLKAKEISGSDSITISAYIFYNIVYAAASYPMGVLADKIGLKKVFVGGLALFAIVYAGFAFNTSAIVIYGLFFLYGFYAAATDGVSKAWITGIAAKGHVATAVGFYNSLQSISTFTASAIAGLLWSSAGSIYLFSFSAVLTIISFLYLTTIKEERPTT